MNGHDYQRLANRTVPKAFEPITESKDLSLLAGTITSIVQVGARADELKKYLFHGHEKAEFRVVFDDAVPLDPITTRRNLMLLNSILGLAGELGEFADHIAHALFYGGKLDQEYLEKELGDIQWYVPMACTALNVSLDWVMAQNIEKLKKRYPEGFSSEASIHRKE